MKAAFHTLGCRVNQYETEAIREQFERAGWDIVGEDQPADAYIINTCTVTNMADRKSRQFIRRAHTEAPDAVIAVTGCYAQTSADEVAEIEGVSLVIGADDKSKVFSLVDEMVRSKNKKTRNAVEMKPYSERETYEELGVISTMEDRCRAFMKIEDGCNRFCSYCIIPYARGSVRSRKPEEIVEEAALLVGNGYKEITLTGINTALYGSDLGMDGIAPLLEMLDKIPGDFRIRLSSLEPMVISPEYVKKLFPIKKLCHHLHLAAQSGSDHVLKAMHRQYDSAEFKAIVDTLREFDPHYGISTDIIAGFPGETEEDVNDSADLLHYMKCCKAHIFRYSKRKGTVAAERTDQIPAQIKKARSEYLIAEGNKAARALFEECRGEGRRVLFEEIEDVDGSGYATGFTDNYIRVYVPSGEFTEAEAADITEGKGLFRDVTLSDSFADGMTASL
ncbi:MAG: tRNA (N(6)-L-threonylcarbamoyladenosine(37)-C(2))-methylthiotransferase MtaB [Eubacteriales bacterium]|nr:tRNA (N(6)-L-threonylcarbamoyladenosine(37)-C(2))-methylthiotransferase MtaB [Eubacteriales bacterium]